MPAGHAQPGGAEHSRAERGTSPAERTPPPPPCAMWALRLPLPYSRLPPASSSLVHVSPCALTRLWWLLKLVVVVETCLLLGPLFPQAARLVYSLAVRVEPSRAQRPAAGRGQRRDRKKENCLYQVPGGRKEGPVARLSPAPR